MRHSFRPGTVSIPSRQAPSPVARLVRLGVLALLSMLATGCDLGQSPTPKVPRGSDGRTCGERLVGSWRFVGFAADVPPPAAQAAQLQSLQSSIRLTFDGRMATTTGAGVQSGNPYTVDSDDGTSCRIVSPDTTGATSEKLVRFNDPNHMEVLDRQSGTPGRASLERTQ